jgi:2'-5' RNA ligase
VTGPGAEDIRLFVAVELEGPALRALAEAQSQLRRRGLEGLRWVRAEGIHLTLKFLGETPAGRVPAIEAALAEAVRGIPPHTVSLNGLGTFGGRRNPRVVWVDVVGEVETLHRLQQRVDLALGRIGFPREDRNFSPHLTLARVRPEAARDLAEPIARALEHVEAPSAEVPVRELSLMRSTLGPGGAVYARLAAFPLV